jgi:hypothetical protein
MNAKLQGNDISAALQKRGVKRLAYFHTDHFEPWRSVPGRPADLARAVDDVEQFARCCEKLEFARRSSLFVKSNVNFAVDDERDLHRVSPEDRLGFVPRNAANRALGKAMLAPVVDLGMELQVHIHHENFVWNGTLKDPATRDYLATPLGKALGPARLELAVRLALEMLREDAGIALDRWFFIHGHWALNGSDPGECTVVREIELLMRNGCLGDFTQPAGRPHVDSRIGEPYLVKPVARAKGYDSEEAQPIAAAGANADDRFFLWATMLPHTSASIDIYSKSIAKRTEQPAQLGAAQAENGVLIDGTLYVKTHGHSMAPAYWEEGGIPFPHAHPAIQRELGLMFEAADSANVDVAFLSCSEVYDEILAAEAPPPEDLVTFWKINRCDPMADQGVTIVHLDSSDTIVDAPPLPFRMPRLAAPGPAIPSAQEVDDALPSIASLENQIDTGAELSDGNQHLSDQLEKSASLVNRLSSSVACALIDSGDAERHGITGFYATRAREVAILQRSEQTLAKEILQRFGTSADVWEIGCGLGVLTTLLAGNGVNAIGLDRNPGRLMVAADIASSFGAENIEHHKMPRFIEGIFPKVVDGEKGLSSSVALVTNLLGSASIKSQGHFIRGLRCFGSVVIDLQRFFTRRTSIEEQQSLIDMFRAEGFPDPEILFTLGDEGRYALFGKARIGVRMTRQNWQIRADRMHARFKSLFQ